MVASGTDSADGIDLFWIPLGAGARIPIVAWNGRLFEAFAAWSKGRPRCDLYHAALMVHVDGTRVVIEMTPAWGGGTGDHGAVVEGPVGMRWLGRSRLFRYQVRRWREGVIPDIDFAVGGAIRVADDAASARRVLDRVPSFPAATWGRDEQRAGEMWNSNSLIAWLLAGSGIDTRACGPPAGGRAPGWAAGLEVAARQGRSPE